MRALVAALLLAGSQASAGEAKAWAFSAYAYTYFVPGDGDYVQPTVTADRDRLHLEGRYQYEATDTGSVWAGYNFAADSWAINEHSNVTANGPPVFPFKTVIPLAGAFLLLQGAVEMIRCVICIRDGQWPSRVQDVEEVDVDKLMEMVHLKTEDIEKLDALVPPEGAK